MEGSTILFEVVFFQLSTGGSLSHEHILPPINLKYTNCFEIQNTNFAKFQFQNNMSKSLLI